MSMSVDQADLDIQRILRAEIRDLRERHQLKIALLHILYAVAMNGPRKGLPSLEAQEALIRQSPLFDEAWYMKAYPDVAASDISAAGHYVRAGAFEGRDPGPNFDSMAYYLANRDAASAGWPALAHYESVGKAEGRPLG